MTIPSTFLSLKQAGELVGKSSETIRRAIENGKISTYKLKIGETKFTYRVDPSELSRGWEVDTDRLSDLTTNAPRVTSFNHKTDNQHRDHMLPHEAITRLDKMWQEQHQAQKEEIERQHDTIKRLTQQIETMTRQHDAQIKQLIGMLDRKDYLLEDARAKADQHAPAQVAPTISKQTTEPPRKPKPTKAKPVKLSKKEKKKLEKKAKEEKKRAAKQAKKEKGRKRRKGKGRKKK